MVTENGEHGISCFGASVDKAGAKEVRQEVVGLVEEEPKVVEGIETWISVEAHLWRE